MGDVACIGWGNLLAWCTDQLSSLLGTQCSCRLVSRICRVSRPSHSSAIMRIRIQLRKRRLKQPRLHFSSHRLPVYDAFPKRRPTLDHPLYHSPTTTTTTTTAIIIIIIFIYNVPRAPNQYRPASIFSIIILYTYQKEINCVHELSSILYGYE